jgi:hypothetical protein
VQGEATITAKTPVRKDSRESLLFKDIELNLAKLLPSTILLMKIKPKITNK